MNFFTQSSKGIASCKVRTLGSLSDQSEQLFATVHLCACVCVVCICMCNCLSVCLYVYWGCAYVCVLVAVCMCVY